MRPQADFTPHLTEMGQGPRKALALHCTMAFSGAWGGVAKVLGDQVTLIAPDMPSHGKSADWDEVSSFADTVFEASLACLSEPMDVIGHSFGGATALRLAIERPDLVRSLTIIEPVFFCIGATDAPGTMANHDSAASGFFNAITEGDREGAARAFNRMWSADGPPWDHMPAYLRDAMTRAIHVVPDTVPFLYDDSANMAPRLAETTVPTLIVRGEHTLDVVKATNAGLANRMPDATEAVIAGAGHMAPITHPAEMAKLWAPLLERA